MVGASDRADLRDAVGLEGTADPELSRRAHQRRARQLLGDDGVARRLEHQALRRPDRERLGQSGRLVAAVERVIPLGTAEVLDGQGRGGSLHEVRVSVDPPLRLGQVGGHVAGPGGEHHRALQPASRR